MSEDQVVSSQQQGAIATVTVQRPDKLNALNAEVIAGLTRAFEELCDPERGVRCAILTGAGKAFVAGADIAAMVDMKPAEARRFAEGGQRLGELMESAPYPVIAAVNGFALGGGLELALACDFIFAADSAKLGQPEVSLAVIPGFGGTQRLARRIGIGRARELIYTGNMIGAEEALRIGLVNKVVPGDELLAAAHKTATKIARMGPLAVAAAKRVMLRGEEATLQTACELEAQAFAALFASEDQSAGMRAFVNKEKIAFTGR